MSTKYAVLIGRFQPVHRGHLSLIHNALAENDRLIICIGSANRSRSPKNPFTFEERKQLILDVINDLQDDIVFLPIDDNLYSDADWASMVRKAISGVIRVEASLEGVDIEDTTVSLYGYEKDHSSYYLNFFPKWKKKITSESYGDFSSTAIREFFYKKYTEHNFGWWNPLTADKLYGIREVRGVVGDLFYSADMQRRLINQAEEWDFDNGYDPAKYPVIVSTVDSVVVQNGHVLVIRRKHRPGMGMLALPGGHLDPNETLEQAALRELREETKIDMSNKHLRNCITKREIFDHPDRSSRARVITTAFLIELPTEETLVSVRPADDAADAFWLPIGEVKADQFFEDHAFIINKLTAGL